MAAQEAVPILMQIVDQIPIEAVLSDDVNGACGVQNQLEVSMKVKNRMAMNYTVSTLLRDAAQE